MGKTIYERLVDLYMHDVVVIVSGYRHDGTVISVDGRIFRVNCNDKVLYLKLSDVTEINGNTIVVS